MKRITDEQLAKFGYKYLGIKNLTTAEAEVLELLAALKTERAKVAELELETANKKLVGGPYVIVNSPQMVKDYIDAGAITDGMVVIIQSKLMK
jgi:hypothetical protein